MCFTPDGKTLVIGDKEDKIQLWDVVAGKMTAALPGHRGTAQGRGLAFLAGGKELVSCSSDGYVRIWDMGTRKLIRTLAPASPKEESPPEGKATAIAVSPDGEQLVVGYHYGSIRVWTTRTWTASPLIPLDGNRVDNRITALAFAPSGLLAWAGVKLGFYDLQRRKVTWQRHANPCAICFSPDEQRVVWGGFWGVVHIEDVKTHNDRPGEPAHVGGAFALAFAPQGDSIASLGADGFVRLWDLASRRQLHAWKRAGVPECPSLGFSPLSRAVMFAQSKKKLTFGNRAKGGEQGSLTLHRAPLLFAASPSGKTIAVLIKAPETDSAIDLYDVASGKHLFQVQHRAVREGRIEWVFPLYHEGSLAFSPDERLLAASYHAQTIHLWDLHTRKLVATLTGHSAPVKSLTFSPDGSHLVSSAYGMEDLGRRMRWHQDTIRIWNIATRRQVGELPCPGLTQLVTHSPTGDLLATITNAEVIRLWEAASGVEVHRIVTVLPNTPSAACFSPDGRHLGTAMKDGTVLLWSLQPPDWSPPQGHLTPGQLERHWKELAGEARQAYRAALTLAADSASVTYLEKHLRPVALAAEKPERIQQLIDELDHESFTRRDAAQAALAKLALQAETALRKALEKPRSLEARTRLTKLLGPLDSCFVKDSAILQEVRAIGVLRRIGTPAARALLKKLAAGAPEAVQTRAARTALAAINQTAR
jgi:WD40 repeat protein